MSLVGMPIVAAEQPGLTIAVTEKFIDVTNVPPHGAVVLLTCARISYQRRTHVDRRVVLLRDDDGDGRVRYTPPEAVPVASVWIAVNFTSGAVAAAAHPDFPLSWTALPPAALRKDAESELAFIEEELPRVVLFLVRPPDVAVWEIFGRDGSITDKDESPNGRLRLAFEEARTIEGRDKAPKHLKKDDVVVAINPGHLDVFTTQVGK